MKGILLKTLTLKYKVVIWTRFTQNRMNQTLPMEQKDTKTSLVVSLPSEVDKLHKLANQDSDSALGIRKTGITK